MKKKNMGGRPTKYKPEYCEEIIVFFAIEAYREVEETITYKDGTTKECCKLVANDLPFLSTFARKIGVCHDTLIEWADKHKEFSEAYKEAKAIQKEILITNGLQGLYPAAAYCFTAKNIAGMRDKQEIEHGLTDPLMETYKNIEGKDLVKKAEELAQEIIRDKRSNPAENED